MRPAHPPSRSIHAIPVTMAYGASGTLPGCLVHHENP